MTQNTKTNVAPDLEYPFGFRTGVQLTDWVSAGLAFIVGIALQSWSPWIHEGLTFRSTVLISAIAAFVLSRFVVSGHKGWMIGLLVSTIAVSAVTAIVLVQPAVIMRKFSSKLSSLLQNALNSRAGNPKISHHWDDGWRKGDLCSGNQKWKQCKNCGAEKILDDEVFCMIEPAYCTPRVQSEKVT